MIFNADDRLVTNSCAKAPSCLFPFSYQGTKGIFVKGDKIAFNWKGEEGAILPLNELRIRGRHNLENAFAASAAAIAFQVDPKAITRALETFTGIEHRQEFVAQFKGVTFINDSKATNLDSGLKALETIASPIILIAGGRGKGESYIPARPLIKEKVKFLITLGETAEQLSEELSDAVKTLYAQDMKEAVALAWKNAVAGDHILLSPMCASFDMFQDFEERGRVFKSFVMELTGGDR
jgi:UDP-N-acetylmuramoylalanine--D-glutamate ligase